MTDQPIVDPGVPDRVLIEAAAAYRRSLDSEHPDSPAHAFDAAVAVAFAAGVQAGREAAAADIEVIGERCNPRDAVLRLAYQIAAEVARREKAGD